MIVFVACEVAALRDSDGAYGSPCCLRHGGKDDLYVACQMLATLAEVYATIVQPCLSSVWDYIVGLDERPKNINKWKGRALVTCIIPLSYFGRTCPSLGSTTWP
jgi:hypothetical protein